eukprot:Rmarinus@m.5188
MKFFLFSLYRSPPSPTLIRSVSSSCSSCNTLLLFGINISLSIIIIRIRLVFWRQSFPPKVKNGTVKSRRRAQRDRAPSEIFELGIVVPDLLALHIFADCIMNRNVFQPSAYTSIEILSPTLWRTLI